MRSTRPQITREIDRDIFRLTWPAVAANITTPLLSLADMAIVGHIGEADLIAAIALGGAVFNMLYWVFGFLRMGTSGITAQAYGARDDNACRLTLMRSLILGLTVGMLMIVCIGPLTRLFMLFMDADRATATAAAAYIRIAILGAPAMMATYSLSGWFLGMQSSRILMWTAIVTNLINIAISATLVFVAGMDIKGVAIGTAVSQWLGAATALTIAAVHYRAFRHVSWQKVLQPKALIKLCKVNGFIFARTVCLVVVTTWFTRIGSLQGPVMLAANALIMQLFMLFSYFTDGLAFAGEALAGRFEGMLSTASTDARVSKEANMMRILIRRLMLWGIAIALPAAVLYITFGNEILSLLTDDHSALTAAREYTPYAALIPLFGFMAFVWDGVYIGRTMAARMFIAMLVSTVVFFAVWFIPLPVSANHHLWLSFLLYLLTRSMLMPLLHRKKQITHRQDKDTDHR